MEKYAIIDVAGRQCKVTPDGVVRVPLLDAEVGSKLSFDKVLLSSDGKTIKVGQPFLEGGVVEAEVLRHAKDRKVVVFKKKRRKKYRRKRGHRQWFTEILVKSLPG